MTLDGNPHVVTVRYNTSFSIVFLVSGAVATIAALLGLLASNGLTFGLFLGPVFLLIGACSFRRPHLAFDTATGTFTIRSAIGSKPRSLGAPKGERIYFDGVNIMRLLPDHRTRKISTSNANREDLARLIAVLPSAGPA